MPDGVDTPGVDETSTHHTWSWRNNAPGLRSGHDAPSSGADGVGVRAMWEDRTPGICEGFVQKLAMFIHSWRDSYKFSRWTKSC